MMQRQDNRPSARIFPRATLLIALTFAGLGTGFGQPAGAPPPAPAAPEPAPKKEGFFDAIERWWDKSQEDFKAGLDQLKGRLDAMKEGSDQAARDAAKATREAADALMKLPNTRIVEGSERCVLAPNGSPDCQSAADAICRGKGFAGGKTANVEVTRKCSPRAILSRSEEDCTNETIVTKAACQ